MQLFGKCFHLQNGLPQKLLRGGGGGGGGGENKKIGEQYIINVMINKLQEIVDE